jgi:hypothetical protein
MSKCPLRSKMYGGLPGGGGYVANTEFEIGAQRFAEAAHCILGSLGKHMIFRTRKPDWHEAWEGARDSAGHLKEEIGIIEYVMDEYSRPVYVRQIMSPTPGSEGYVEASIESIRKASPKLRAKAKQMKAELEGQEDVPQEVLDVALATYDAVIELTEAMEIAVRKYPDRVLNPFGFGALGAAVKNIRAALNRLMRAPEPTMASTHRVAFRWLTRERA